MSSTVDLPGAAHLVLAADVAYLEPETAVFTAMVDGWGLQQRTRFLKPATISSRLTLLRRVAAFCARRSSLAGSRSPMSCWTSSPDSARACDICGRH